MASYADGVTIKVNDVAATITAAEQQADKSVIRYTLSAPVEAGDTVTLSYDKAAGSIVAETGGAALADVTAQEVTNNVSADPIGDALRADAIADWTMDETSGARADLTERGNDLAEYLPVSSAAGKVNRAAFFEGAEGLYKASNSDLNVGGSSYTFSAWVLFQGGFPSDKGIITKEDTTIYADPYYICYFKPLNRITFIIGDGVTYPKISADDIGAPSLNVWYFIICWYDKDSSTINIQVNGGIVNTLTVEISPADNDGIFTISGVYGGGTNPCNGYIDEVGFWKRVLTPEERAYLYNSGAGRALFPAP